MVLLDSRGCHVRSECLITPFFALRAVADSLEPTGIARRPGPCDCFGDSLPLWSSSRRALGGYCMISSFPTTFYYIQNAAVSLEIVFSVSHPPSPARAEAKTVEPLLRLLSPASTPHNQPLLVALGQHTPTSTTRLYYTATSLYPSTALSPASLLAPTTLRQDAQRFEHQAPHG